MDREEYLELVKMNTGIEITSVESSNPKIRKQSQWQSQLQ